MAFSLTTRRVRLQADYTENNAVIDRKSGKRISIPLATEVRFEIGIFAGLKNGAPNSANQVASVTDWESLTLTLQQSRGTNFVSKTVSSFTALTYATWNDDTGQHCTVDLTDSETNIPPGRYKLALTVETADFGPCVFGSGEIDVFDAHSLNSADPADVNPGAPISRDAADQRYAPLGGGSTCGNCVFVDVDGSDTTGARERFDKPFLTLEAARTAAQAGDTIYVRSGSYTVTASLAKAGVHWHFAPGTSVTKSNNANVAIWDDNNTAMSFSVTGHCDFTRTTSNATTCDLIRVRHASSVISIAGRDFTVAAPGGADSSLLRQEGGTVTVEGRYANGSATNAGFPSCYAFWWFNGEGTVRFRKITSDYATVFGGVQAAPTGEFHAYAEEIFGAVGFANVDNSVALPATMWIQCNILREVPAENPTNSSVTVGGYGKIYVTAQKIYGFVAAAGFSGIVYVTAQKHEATRSISETSQGPFIDWGQDGSTTGTLFYNVNHLDPKTFTGPCFQVFSGTVNVGTASLTTGAATEGITLNGGTLNLGPGVYINTSANNATNPVTIHGGTLKVEGRLISQGARKSIANGDAGTYTVDAWGGRANNDADTGITANGLTVDSTVT